MIPYRLEPSRVSSRGLFNEVSMTIRKKNNAASKRSRMTKKDKQKQMDEKIQFYIEDNSRCIKQIAQMEKEIQYCKDYLFSKVMNAAKH